MSELSKQINIDKKYDLNEEVKSDNSKSASAISGRKNRGRTSKYQSLAKEIERFLTEMHPNIFDDSSDDIDYLLKGSQDFMENFLKKECDAETRFRPTLRYLDITHAWAVYLESLARKKEPLNKKISFTGKTGI